MAKAVRCPTCGTRIEIRPDAIGQVVKCPSCGKGIKLVKKAGGPGGAGSAAASTSSLGESQRSFIGEAALDDPPSLDTTNCALCGKLVDQADLIEDAGQLICKECAVASAGARSGEDAPDLMPAYRPLRRGKLVTLSPLFFAFCFCAAVYGATAVYLDIMPQLVIGGKKPKVVAVAPTATRPAASANWEQDNRAKIDAMLKTADDAQNSASDQESGKAAEAKYKELFALLNGHDDDIRDPRLAARIERAKMNRQSLLLSLASSASTTEPTTAPVAGAPENPQVTSTAPAAPTTEQIAAGPTAATQPDNTQPEAAPAAPATSNLLLASAILKLRRKEYAGAETELERLRRDLVKSGGAIPDHPDADQSLLFDGIIAARLGLGKTEAAKTTLIVLKEKNVQWTPTMTINAAIVFMNSRPTFDQLKLAATAMQGAIGSVEPSEYTANVFGALVQRLNNMPNAKKPELESFWQAFDAYADRMADKHPGMLKWGVDWLPEEQVKRLRAGRNLGPDAGNASASRDLFIARTTRDKLKREYEVALAAQKQGHGGGDIDTARHLYDAAQEKVTSLEERAGVHKNGKLARWPDKFDPACP